MSYDLGIDLMDGQPLCGKIYSILYRLYDRAIKELDRLIRLGVIRESTSRYSSPSFVLEKKNGDVRFITDFKELNKRVKIDIFPFPSIEEQLVGLKGAIVFSVIDLDKGFYQIDIRENDCYKTAFTTPLGHFEYCKVPLGLVNSPKHFQRTMLDILKGFQNVKIFMDDILIYDKTYEEHLRRVKKVLQRLEGVGAKVNFEKSMFMKKEIRFLGCKISELGIEPDTFKVKNT